MDLHLVAVRDRPRQSTCISLDRGGTTEIWSICLEAVRFAPDAMLQKVQDEQK